jgi:hypothetical protein
MNKIEFAIQQLLDSRINNAITFDDMNSRYEIESAEIYKKHFIELLNTIKSFTPSQFDCIIEVKDNLVFIDFVKKGQENVSLCGIRFGYIPDISTTENIDEYSKYNDWAVYGPVAVNFQVKDLDICLRILEAVMDGFKEYKNDAAVLSESINGFWNEILNEALYNPWNGFKFKRGDIVQIIKDTPLDNMPLDYKSPNRLGTTGVITLVDLSEERPYYFVEFTDGDRGRYYPSWCLKIQ